MIFEHGLIPYEESEIPSGSYLVFAPHPDDETLGMGGTIALASASGLEVNVVFVTNGDKGGEPEVRKKEADAAAKVLGVRKKFYLNLPDREVFNSQFPEERLADILKETRPATLFLPSFQEIHPDHRAVTHNMLSFLDKKDYSFELWFYEINRQGEINRLIDISSVVDRKESAIDCYKSQLDQLDYKSHTLCLDLARGITLSCGAIYAEGFWCHDAGSGIRPENEYFNQINKYRSNAGLSLFEEDKLKKELRSLKDAIHNQSFRLLNSFKLTGAVSDYLNQKVHDNKILQAEQEKNFHFIESLNKKLYEIHCSKSHRLASLYITLAKMLKRTCLNLRIKFKQKYSSVKKKYGSGSKKKAQLFLADIETDTDKLNGDHSIPWPLPGHEPMVRLYSGDEVDNNGVQANGFIRNMEPDIDKPGSTPEKNLVQLHNNIFVDFTIRCGKKNLCSMELYMATYSRINPGRLILKIYADAERKRFVRTSEVRAPGVVDNSFTAFDFEPVADSENREFFVSLGLEGGVRERCVGLWTCPVLEQSRAEKYGMWIKEHDSFSMDSVADVTEYKIIKDKVTVHSQFANCKRLQGAADARRRACKRTHVLQVPDNARAVPCERLVDIDQFSHKPCLSIIIPVTDTDKIMLADTMESVIGQIYPFWQIVVVCFGKQGGQDDELQALLKKYSEKEKRVTVQHSDKAHGICHGLNFAAQGAKGEYILVLDQYDTLALNALYELVKLLNDHSDTDFIYSDEDRLTIDGQRIEPFFKPDWSPDLLLSCMYTCSLSLYRKDIFLQAGGFQRDYENCRDYDLVLRVSEMTDKIQHISKILYHRREIETCSADVVNKTGFERYSAKKALFQAVKRRGINAEICDGLTPQSFRVLREIDQKYRVSIIIPFKDKPEVLETCVQSILDKTDYNEYEIICVNNQSSKKETFSLMKSLESVSRVSFLDYDMPFNFSALNNFAVTCVQGDILVFLNSDTEVISGNWLDAMLEHACRDDVGAVGARLYYVNDTIQHAGVVLGVAGFAGHAFKHVSRFEPDYYYGFSAMIRNVSCVTAACMMVRRSVFDEVGGFDEENFKISYNDLDLCLKIRQKGYEIIYTPFAELYHYESYSRIYDSDSLAIEEISKKWKEHFKSDPYYNQNLNRSKEDWSLG